MTPKDPRRYRIAIGPQSAMKRSRELFFAAVERIGPSKAAANLLQADVAARATDLRHQPPVAVGRKNFHIQ